MHRGKMNFDQFAASQFPLPYRLAGRSDRDFINITITGIHDIDLATCELRAGSKHRQSYNSQYSF